MAPVRPPRETRLRRRLTVRYASQQKTRRTAFTGNIGRQGLFVVSRIIEKPGTQIEIDVELPRAEKAHLVGRVIWGRRVPPGLETLQLGGFGVRLENPPSNWEAFVASIQRTPAQKAGAG